jgi:mRNA interferase YafQ
MRTIDRASRFRKDFKRESKGQYRDALRTELMTVLDLLLRDEPLPTRFADHALTGKWLGYRDCHVKPDLVLIYRKSKPNILELARLGTHSELGF